VSALYPTHVTIIYLGLLAVAGIVVRRVAVLVVERGGIYAGLVLLAAIFWLGHYLGEKYDL
jgi:hypothetical protein